jgi:ABC-2 type transport system permease protein
VSNFAAALWAEVLKARRSLVPVLTAAGALMLPLAGGLFIIILKDPAQARALGLISAKAQLMVGVADWPAYFQILLQGTAAAGAVLFSIITAWVFGREFSDHPVKELLALPTPRRTILSAKFVLILLWNMTLGLLIFVVGIAVAGAVDIPGWSFELELRAFGLLMLIALLTYMLMPFVALLAGVGRGFLAPLGWTFFTLALAQIAAVLGWGDWFPWSVPALLSGAAGPQAAQLGVHSYLMVLAAFTAAFSATSLWWQRADQAR